MIVTPGATSSLSDQQQAVFRTQMAAYQKDEVAGVLLAFFLGSFGAHHFYLRRNGLGILYLLFFWTGIPAILGVIECFFMPGRVRQYNLQQAALLAASLGGVAPAVYVPDRSCTACGAALVSGTRFCGRCGTPVRSA